MVSQASFSLREDRGHSNECGEGHTGQPPQQSESFDIRPLEDGIDVPILALDCKNKRLGGAYWRADDSTLVLLGDIQCADVIDMLNLGTHCSKQH